MEKRKRNGVILAIVAVIVVVAIIAASMGLNRVKSDANDAKLTVLSMNVDKHNILINDTVNVTVLVSNNGIGHAVQTLTLMIDRDLTLAKSVSLEAGAVQNVSFVVTPSTPGNHTLSCGGNSTFFTSYPRWWVGDYQVESFVSGYNEVSNITSTVTGINGSMITLFRSYDNGARPNSSVSMDSSLNSVAMLTNIRMVGKEVVHTNFGDKLLSHYVRSDPAPTYDIYMDESSRLVFKQVTTASPFVITEVLIGTNMPWVHDLAKA